MTAEKVLNRTSEIELAYASLDMSPKGEIGAQILEHLDDEGRHDQINLTDQIGAIPANLTGAMAIWYGDYVGAYRRAALDAVDAALGAVTEVQGAPGMFLERVVDQITDDRISRKRQARARHLEQNAAAYSKLKEQRQNFERARREYDNIHARYGRAPKVIRWWYFLLLLIVGLTDMAVNYDSVLSTPGWDRPVLAAGAAVVIAMLLAFSAHLHGALLRQWGTRFGAFQDDHDRAAAWRMLGLGTAGLSVSLAAVWYFRSQFLSTIIVEQSVVGGTAPSWLTTVGGSLTTNVAVWIIGVILAFLLHDPDPNFPDALKERDKQEHELRNLQKALDVPLRREFERLDAIADRAIEQARTQDQSLSHFAEYKRGRRLFEQVAQQDARVVAILENYRGRLINRLRQRPGVSIRRAPDIAGADEQDEISIEEYYASPLKIKYL